MNKRRLLKLADLLEADAKKKNGIRFDLNAVAKRSDGGQVGRGDVLALDCGTTACAIGLWGICGKFPGVTSVVDPCSNQVWPVYKKKEGRTAAELYFGINICVSEWLFLSQYYDGPTSGAAGERAVAKRIRDFVDGRAQP